MAAARPDRRLAAMGFPLATVMVLLLGVILVYLFFVRPDAFNEWFAFKPGILAEMTSDSGKLQVQPYKETLYWYEWSANFHSSRWADTLLFLGLRDVTGTLGTVRENRNVFPTPEKAYLLAEGSGPSLRRRAAHGLEHGPELRTDGEAVESDPRGAG